jgi:hypothetical protein
LILVELAKRSNLVGLLLEQYYFVLAGLRRSKNQVNKYFHTIFSPVEVSIELVEADPLLLNVE